MRLIKLIFGNEINKENNEKPEQENERQPEEQEQNDPKNDGQQSRENQKENSAKSDSQKGEGQQGEGEQGEGQQEGEEQEGEDEQGEEQQGEGQQESKEQQSEGQQGEQQEGEGQQGEGQQEGEEQEGEGQQKSEEQQSEGQQGEQQEGEGQQGEGQQEGEDQEGEGQQEGKEQQSEGQQDEQQEGEGQQGEGQQESEDQESEGPEGNDKNGEQQENNEESNKLEEDKKSEEESEEENEPEEVKEEKPEKEPDALKTFRELLKYDVNQNISKGIGNPSIPNLSSKDEDEVPDSVIRTLFDKFLNQTFTINVTDLNFRGESLKKTTGNLRWDIPKLVRDKVTMQYPQMLVDKYGYEKENRRDERIPLSIYFDLSGSMDAYARELSIIALKCLRAGIKVIIGENEQIEIQIDNVPKNFSADDMLHIFNNKRSPKDKTEITVINRNIAEYLKEKKAEKAIVFSDFDPKSEIETLSQFCKVYWFCTEERSYYKGASLKDFKRIFL